MPVSLCRRGLVLTSLVGKERPLAVTAKASSSSPPPHNLHPLGLNGVQLQTPTGCCQLGREGGVSPLWLLCRARRGGGESEVRPRQAEHTQQPLAETLRARVAQ